VLPNFLGFSLQIFFGVMQMATDGCGRTFFFFYLSIFFFLKHVNKQFDSFFDSSLA